MRMYDFRRSEKWGARSQASSQRRWGQVALREHLKVIEKTSQVKECGIVLD